MARVLVYTCPGSGHAFPPVATALALRERGHEVSMRTAAGSVETLGRLGLSAAPIDPRIEAIPLEDWKARTPIGALISALDTFRQRGAIEISDLQAAIEAERPDLIWVDTNAPGAAVVAEASGLPWAHCMPYPHPAKDRYVPSFGPGFAPSMSLRSRARDWGLDAFKKLAFRPFLRAHNARRAAFDLAPIGIEEIHLAAPLVILCSAPPFEYKREKWPPNVRMVGPALWEPPAEEEPAWLAAEERPIVLVTASTEFQDDAKLIRCALEAFAGRPYAVVATSSAHDPDDFQVPANARVERFLPHGPILRRASVVISHGGMGTTQKALAAGVPVCVVPFMRDQFEVARRVEHCGGGVILHPRRLRPDRLRAAVEGAIECRPGAERVRDAFRRAGGAEAAASALEALIAERQPAEV